MSPRQKTIVNAILNAIAFQKPYMYHHYHGEGEPEFKYDIDGRLDLGKIAEEIDNQLKLAEAIEKGVSSE